MSDGITLAVAQTKVAECLAAEAALLTGAQSYTIGNRSLSRVELAQLAGRLAFWRGEVQRLTALGAGARSGVLTAAWS